MTEFIPAELDRYCYWQTERESIRIKKESAVLSPPWTDDPILQEFKFCQVFREDDRTTRWFRTHIRENLCGTKKTFLWLRLYSVGLI